MYGQGQVAALLLATLTGGGPVRASLDIDASALGDAGPAVEARLTTRGERVLRDADVLPGSKADDALISIRLDTLPDAVGYRYAYTVTRGGELVEGTRGAAECRLCSEAELTEQLDVAITRLAARLQTGDPAPVAAAPVAPTPALDTGPQPTARGWTVRPLGTTGIVLTGVGGLTLGLGAGLAIAEPVLLGGSGARNSTVSVAGLAVAVAGVALAGTGIALMVVDRKQSRRRSARWNGTTLRF